MKIPHLRLRPTRVPASPQAASVSAQPSVAQAVDTVARYPSPKHRSVFSRPPCPNVLPATATAATAKLFFLFDCEAWAIDLVIAHVAQRYGVKPELLPQARGRVRQALAGVELDKHVSAALRGCASDTDLNAAADTLAQRHGDNVPRRVAALSETLAVIARNPPRTAARVLRTTISQSTRDLVNRLVPAACAWGSDPAFDALARAVDAELTPAESKAALMWVTSPQYAQLMHLDRTVAHVLKRRCMSQAVVDAVLQAVAPAQLAQCDVTLRNDAHDIAARRLRAHMFVATRAWAAALTDFDAVIAAGAHHADYFARAAVHERLGHSDSAEADLEDAVRLALDNGAYYAAYLQASVGNVSREINRTPNDATLYIVRGTRRLALGEASAGQRDYNEAARREPDNIHLQNLADALQAYAVTPLPLPVPFVFEKPEAASAKRCRRLAPRLAALLPLDAALEARAMSAVTQIYHLVPQAHGVQARIEQANASLVASAAQTLAQVCDGQTLADFEALLNTPQSSIILAELLPLAQRLQAQTDAWQTSLRTDAPVQIMVAAPDQPPALRTMVQALVPDLSADAQGITGAFADGLGASAADSLPTPLLAQCLGLLKNTAVQTLVAVYARVLNHAFTDVVAPLLPAMALDVAPETVQQADALLAEDADNIAARRARAHAYALLENDTEALSDYDRILATDVTAEGLVDRSLQQLAMGFPVDALRDADEAVQRAPLSADVYATRATVYLAQQDFMRARCDAERAQHLALSHTQKQRAAELCAATSNTFTG